VSVIHLTPPFLVVLSLLPGYCEFINRDHCRKISIAFIAFNLYHYIVIFGMGGNCRRTNHFPAILTNDFMIHLTPPFYNRLLFAARYMPPDMTWSPGRFYRLKNSLISAGVACRLVSDSAAALIRAFSALM